MKLTALKYAAVALAGFGVGLLAEKLPLSGLKDGATELSHKTFSVSIDEVRQNFIFGDHFSGRYTKTFTLSDGSQRTIELTPMVHNGMQVVELKDGHGGSDEMGRTFMGLNGTTTNGTLMIELRDESTQRKLLKAEGWPLS